jgi:hypothetical protein
MTMLPWLRFNGKKKKKTHRKPRQHVVPPEQRREGGRIETTTTTTTSAGVIVEGGGGVTLPSRRISEAGTLSTSSISSSHGGGTKGLTRSEAYRWLQEGDRLLYEAIDTRCEQWLIEANYRIQRQTGTKLDKLRFANRLEEAKHRLSLSITSLLGISSSSSSSSTTSTTSIPLLNRRISQEVCLGKLLLGRAYMEMSDFEMALSCLLDEEDIGEGGRMNENLHRDGHNNLPQQITTEQWMEWFSAARVSDYIRQRHVMFAAMMTYTEIMLMEERRSTQENASEEGKEQRSQQQLDDTVNRLEEFLVRHVDFERMSRRSIEMNVYDPSECYWIEEMMACLPFLRFKRRSMIEAVKGWRRYLVLFSGRASFRKPMVLRALHDVLTYYVSESNYLTVIDSLPKQWNLDTTQFYVPSRHLEEIQWLAVIQESYVPSNLPLKVSSDLTHLPLAYQRAFTTLMFCQNYALIEEVALHAMKKGYGNSEEFNKYYMMNFFIMGKYREAFMLYEYLAKHEIKDPFVYLMASLSYLDGLDQVSIDRNRRMETRLRGVN